MACNFQRLPYHFGQGGGLDEGARINKHRARGTTPESRHAGSTDGQLPPRKRVPSHKTGMYGIQRWD
eukprot:3909705-Amphidinium_carterae.1